MDESKNIENTFLFFWQLIFSRITNRVVLKRLIEKGINLISPRT